ncbi:MAG: hydantoinase/oxoprolinase family protein [Hyphomicrobiales bacterium]
MSRFRIGIDIGGTFTDFVLVDEREKRIHLAKRLTTHHDYLDAIFRGLDELVGAAGIGMPDISSVVHGTTLVTNTVIERKGAKTALLTTAGARDVVEIGSELRYDIYDLTIERPPPLVPRHLRYEIPERMGADGAVLRPLELCGMPSLVSELRAAEVAAVAVCLLHSYANPSHEAALGEELKRLFPAAEVTLSSSLVPEIREYERASTSIVNAYVQPLVSRYLRDMELELKKLQMGGPLHLMLSSGGLASVEESIAAPVSLIESGPAGGAIAACYFGEVAGAANLISFDMGGTTAKMCLVNDGRPTRAHAFEAARIHRFKRGSGLPLRVSVIEMIEIGAGGGSIARIDNMGLIKVGPESAGSDPGPACYGLGGRRPTVTDADVVLGYLDPAFFLGGTMSLDRNAAERAIMQHIGMPLGLDAVGAAAGIQEIVNESMATATRLHVSERGRDLRAFTLLAFGGAGPVHAYRVAQLLGLKALICPYAAGNASAFGFLVAPLAIEQVRSYVASLERIDWMRLDGLFREMEENAASSLGRLGVSRPEIAFERSADMRFAGQGFEVETRLPSGKLCADRTKDIAEMFLAAYRRLFERAPEGLPIEGLSWRLRATGMRPKFSLDFKDRRTGSADARKGSRSVYFHHERSYRDCAVYDRYRLAPSTRLQGPAVIEERESTVVVGEGAVVEVDQGLNLIVTLP